MGAMDSRSVQRQRKLRLLQMVEIARLYRGCSKNELASRLDRDPAKIIPDSGNPKLDLVVGLADALNWSVADVIDAVWGRLGMQPIDPPTESFEELNLAAVHAHRLGDFETMIKLGRQMLQIADDARSRASAAWRMAGGFEGLGFYAKALEWMQMASKEPDLPPPSKRVLRANLAACHYALGNLIEATAIARDVLSGIPDSAVEDRRDRSAQALSHYVVGNSARRSMSLERSNARIHAEAAVPPLRSSRDEFEAMSRAYDDESYRGISNTCAGALIECEVELGIRTARQAIDLILGELGGVEDVSAWPRGDLLESWGWWAIFGCNIARRHLEGEERDRVMAILSNKASDVAERQGNWSMREQVFTLEFLHRSDNPAADGRLEDWVLDRDDLRNLVGTMGRFGSFRDIGWEILSRVQILGLQGGMP